METTIKAGDILLYKGRCWYDKAHFYKVMKVCPKTIKARVLETEHTTIEETTDGSGFPICGKREVKVIDKYFTKIGSGEFVDVVIKKQDIDADNINKLSYIDNWSIDPSW